MRRIITLIILLALVFSLFSYSASAANDVCYIAVNETLLELDTTPYFYGSAFVPYSVFGSFKIYSSYFPSSNTISLYRSDKQLYFDLTTGKAYDGDDNYYTTSTLTRNGQFYVSVQFVCNFFGLNWSHIKGIGYGDVLRITDGGNYLSDSDFLYAASGLMQARYEAYMSSLTTATPTTPTTTSSPAITSPSPEVSPNTHEGTSVYLSFEGMPSDTMLSSLKSYSVLAAFYLTPEEIISDPDRVRKIVGSGHSIGILCSSDFEQDFNYGSELLFEAAQVKTVMISSSGENLTACRAFAQQQSLVCYNYDINGTGTAVARVTASLDTAEGNIRVRLDCSNSTENLLDTILRYLYTNKYDLRLEREV
ncbi:MAG: polysaccharide deacetylase family protein [Oscillospiraceae bacterium]